MCHVLAVNPWHTAPYRRHYLTYIHHHPPTQSQSQPMPLRSLGLQRITLILLTRAHQACRFGCVCVCVFVCLITIPVPPTPKWMDAICYQPSPLPSLLRLPELQELDGTPGSGRGDGGDRFETLLLQAEVASALVCMYVCILVCI